MSEKIYDVPAEWKERAFIDEATELPAEESGKRHIQLALNVLNAESCVTRRKASIGKRFDELEAEVINVHLIVGLVSRIDEVAARAIGPDRQSSVKSARAGVAFLFKPP